MKKITSIMSAVCAIGFLCAFNMLSGGGHPGATGSPGENTCGGGGNCHNGGAAGTTVSITSTPAFTNNLYAASTNYTITVTVNHPSQPAFGFGCEILGSGNANAGVMANAGSGTQFMNSGARKNAIHTLPKAGVGGSASWSFEWMSPTAGTATIFAAGNAVNSSNNFQGDSPGNTMLSLDVFTTSTVGFVENTKNQISHISLFPNPASDFTTLSYYTFSTQAINIELTDISGKIIKTLLNENQEPGSHSNILDLKGISKGIYFVKISSNGSKISQKLISVQ